MSFKENRIKIAFDETHHVYRNKPMYENRFLRVLSFHNDIAVAEMEKGFIFINKQAKNIFNRIYIKAYGFYEGFATVEDKTGFYHINEDGEPAYETRYSWLGNFQEGVCTAKNSTGQYFHIDADGMPIYHHKFCYVGDFKYDIAVAMNQDGKFTHINKMGNSIHNVFFDDLQPFHKGYAVAKDESGYFHITKKGNPLYQKRYKRLEPFYNGAAFATTFNDKRIILSENEIAETELTSSSHELINIDEENFRFFRMQVLYTILKLDIFNYIRNKEKIPLPEISVKLIIRWLKAYGLIVNDELTERVKIIEKKYKDLILYWQDLPFKVSSSLERALLKGDETFSELYNLPFFNYMNENKAQKKLTSDIYSKYSVDYSAIVDYMNLTNEVVCDLGAGSGSLLSMIRMKYPDVKTIFADKYFENEYHQSVYADFFKPINIDADVYILSRVLHDWCDDKAIEILSKIKTSMKKGSKLMIIDTIIPDEIGSDKGITLSFHLLSFVGGYERSKSDFRAILRKAGFCCDFEFITTGSIVDLIILT